MTEGDQGPVVSDIYGIKLHAAAGFIDSCHDLAYYSAWFRSAPPKSAHPQWPQLLWIFGLDLPWIHLHWAGFALDLFMFGLDLHCTLPND